ncbi:MAG: HPr(Ser) kinase/phosphatase [Thiotrichales bacterium]
MHGQIYVRELIQDLRKRVACDWIAGEAAGDRLIDVREAKAGSAPLVGHFSLIHPNQIELVGHAELTYLTGLEATAQRESYAKLFNGGSDLVILTDGITAPEPFQVLANAAGVALVATRMGSFDTLAELRYILAERLAEQLTLHGVFIEVVGIGVLIVGETSIGKSELALELISRGHRLIADDAPLFSKLGPDLLSGSCPEMLCDFLEVRGLGILNVRAMFGNSAVKPRKHLRLIIRLRPFSQIELDADARLNGLITQRMILGVTIPEITLPIAPGRNLAVLVEAAVRNFMLQANGYNASLDFQARLNRNLENQTS